ncbi:DUF5753 domain-containing protein [Streptomyces sp. NPDC000151]|uniref:DUF5753 domain-containing protein n=1 Tax=Streptomyces sp. NPDC000151 TaxID=3154244 RepID=UPI00332A895E
MGPLSVAVATLGSGCTWTVDRPLNHVEGGCNGAAEEEGRPEPGAAVLGGGTAPPAHGPRPVAEALAKARMERRALLDRKPVCCISVIHEEAALRRRLGGLDVMRRQYEHLIECAQRPNVVLQVMPMSQGEHAGLYGPMTVIETPEQTTLAYLEGNGHSTLVSRPEEVGVLARRYAMIGRQALRPEESTKLIKQLRDEL